MLEIVAFISNPSFARGFFIFAFWNLVFGLGRLEQLIKSKLQTFWVLAGCQTFPLKAGGAKTLQSNQKLEIRLGKQRHQQKNTKQKPRG